MLLFSSSPCFFLGLHLPKLQKPQNKIKQTFLLTLENKKGITMKKTKGALKEKKKKGSQSSPFAETW
jgi:hypothetical protein